MGVMQTGERFNSISHLVGAGLALVGGSALVTLAATRGDAVEIASVAVYGATLFLLYLCSTLYHAFRGRAKRVFRKLDHSAIYLLIAGTWTPFAALGIGGSTGNTLLAIVWGLAALGILVDNVPIPGPRVLPVILCLAMGWLVLFALDALVAALPAASFAWLLAGGIVYTAGVGFYVADHWLPWCHEIWHLFVLGGSVSHFVAISLL